MELQALKLSNFSPPIEIEKHLIPTISNNLKYVCILSSTGTLKLYCITREQGSISSQKLIWQSNFQVHSFIFSEDGNNLMVVSEDRTFQTFQLSPDGAETLLEKDVDELSISLEKYGIEFSQSSEITLQMFHKDDIIIIMNSTWLLTLKWYCMGLVIVTNKLELPSCVTTVMHRSILYSLSLGGNVSAYNVEDGRQLGVVNLYSLVPRGYTSEMQVFSNMAVSLDGTLLVVADRAGQLFIVNVKSYFFSSDQQEGSCSKWDCGVSIMSNGSGTSLISCRTISSLLYSHSLTEDNASLRSFDLKKERYPSFTSHWNSYLKSLTQKSSSRDSASGNKWKRNNIIEETGSTLKFISQPPSGYTINSLHINSAGLSVWYTHPDEAFGGVYQLYDLSSNRCTAEMSVPDDSMVIPGGFLGLVDAFISPASLWLFLGNLSRDLLVSKLLHCVETESVGQFLQGEEWGDLVVPLPALADGLKQQQMDVAHLALGLHAQAFKTSLVRSPTEELTSWQIRTDNISNNMDKLFYTIQNAIKENIQKFTFHDHLVLLSLDHANDLLNFLQDSQLISFPNFSSTEQAIKMKTMKELIKRVMYHVVELRQHLYKRVKSKLPEQEQHQPLKYLSQEFQCIWEKWKNFNDEMVVQDAVSHNTISLAQVFLVSIRNWKGRDFQTCFREIVQSWIQNLLINNDIEKARLIYMNLGCEPEEELIEICKQSRNRHLRDDLAKYLSSKGLLKPEELEAWSFLKRMESILEHVKLPASCTFVEEFLCLRKADVSLSDIPENEKQSLSIATFTNQTREWQDMILVDLFFNIPGTTLESDLKPELVWKYLLHHNNEDLIFSWIDSYFSGDSLSGNTQNNISGLLKWIERMNEVTFETEIEKKVHDVSDMLRMFSSWKISQTMIDSVYSSDAMQRTKDLVLDQLSRYGIFSSREREKPNAILSRTIRTKTFLNLEKTLALHTANVTYEEFQDLLTNLVIRNDLFNIPFSCFQDFEFSDEKVQTFCMPFTEKECSVHWFQLWLAFRQLVKNPSDETFIHEAIIKSTQFLGSEKLQDYLKEHPLVVLALIIFSSQSVSDVFMKRGNCGIILNDDTLEATLKQLPPLDKALSLVHEHSKQKADVTFYQLLEGCTQFDVSKLFGWQKLNFIEGEEFPYFASPHLIEKYGSKHTLTYLDYLKQGRPSFAVNRFIVDQFRAYGKLTKKMMKEACNFAHGLALQKFDDTSITSTCIGFIEMLGRDSENVRIHVSAGSRILMYLGRNDTNSKCQELHKEKVGSLLYGLVISNTHIVSEMMTLLQEALQYEFTLQQEKKNQGSSRQIINAILHWNLAVKFARIHGLKLPEFFLKQCASQDEWLLFILFVQLYCYPLDQVLQLVKSFHSANLREHLHHALGHNISEETEKTKTTRLSNRDSRKMFYSRIGLKKGETKEKHHTAPDDAISVHPNNSSNEDSPQSYAHTLISVDFDYQNERDLFCTLLKCHRSSDPPRALLAASQLLINPVLAVLATCYEPSSVLTCFCVWLITSLSPSTMEHVTAEFSSPLQQHTWSAVHVENLLQEIVSSKHITTLAHGFKIFYHDNPLCAFTDFLNECVVKKNFQESVKIMKAFIAMYLNLKNGALVQEQDDIEGIFMTNGSWVASTAAQLIVIAICKCFSSSYHQLQFLYTLQKAEFSCNLSVNFPDLVQLTRLLECLSGTGVSLNMEVMFLIKDKKKQEEELLQCFQKLVKEKQFAQGLQLSFLANLPKDDVIVAQWSDCFEEQYVKRKSLEMELMTFWNKCHNDFKEANIDPYTAAKFFQDHAEKVTECDERYHILQLAFQWFRDVKVESDPEAKYHQEMASVELNMWTCWLKAENDLPLSYENIIPVLLHNVKSEVLKIAGISALDYSVIVTNEQEKSKLNSLIGKLLDHGDVAAACRLGALFNHANQDIQIILTCMSLAEGELSPYQLPAEHRLLVSEVSSISGMSFRRRTLLSSVSSKPMNMVPDVQQRPVVKTPKHEVSYSPLNCSLGSDYVEIPARDHQDTLIILEKLAERINHGKNVGRRIVMCYRVAMNLDKSYQEIISLKDPLSLLKTAIADDCINKFIVANDLMSTAQISREEVSEYLCTEIVAAIARGNIPGDGGIFMWGCDLSTNFRLVLDICDDPSTLGSKLLASASQLETSRVETIRQAVELTVHAHDCYTATCNMEGISSVLTKARSLTKCLQNKQEWALMVRLLTGVGRYTEMRYVFQILRDNEQFEFLLGKGLDKVPGLKLAVLDFLKLYCPEDRKLFQIVALHFAMFGEVATLWENDGKTKIDSLLDMSLLEQRDSTTVLLSNTDVTKQCLCMAMECFQHAAEFYLRANKLTRAMAIAHQAELVALQIALVSAVPSGQNVDSLLKISAQQVSSVIANKLSFPEACIVARAYSHPVDWGAALYQHCIVNRESSYLSDFTHNMNLTTALVEDVARRFQMDNNVTHEMAVEMKKFVQCVTTVEVKYRVASQLGYRDIIESMLNGPEVAYLKDTVWRRGFRR